MQCDTCGKFIENSNRIYPNVYGFSFCDPLSGPIEEECCEDIFERNLWETAQASKEAKQKAASETQVVSGSTPEVVAGIAGE